MTRPWQQALWAEQGHIGPGRRRPTGAVAPLRHAPPLSLASSGRSIRTAYCQRRNVAAERRAPSALTCSILPGGRLALAVAVARGRADVRGRRGTPLDQRRTHFHYRRRGT